MRGAVNPKHCAIINKTVMENIFDALNKNKTKIYLMAVLLSFLFCTGNVLYAQCTENSASASGSATGSGSEHWENAITGGSFATACAFNRAAAGEFAVSVVVARAYQCVTVTPNDPNDNGENVPVRFTYAWEIKAKGGGIIHVNVRTVSAPGGIGVNALLGHTELDLATGVFSGSEEGFSFASVAAGGPVLTLESFASVNLQTSNNLGLSERMNYVSCIMNITNFEIDPNWSDKDKYTLTVEQSAQFQKSEDGTRPSSIPISQLLQGDLDLDGFINEFDCDYEDPTVYPGAPELCDGKDNDCNEIVDDTLNCGMPLCDIQLNGTSFVDGDTVTADVFRYANVGTAAIPVEWAIWMEAPEVSFPIRLLKIGSLEEGTTQSMTLPPGIDVDDEPTDLFTVDSTFPRGDYVIGLKMVDPVTQKLLTFDLNHFTILP